MSQYESTLNQEEELFSEDQQGRIELKEFEDVTRSFYKEIGKIIGQDKLDLVDSQHLKPSEIQSGVNGGRSEGAEDAQRESFEPIGISADDMERINVESNLSTEQIKQMHDACQKSQQKLLKTINTPENALKWSQEQLIEGEQVQALLQNVKLDQSSQSAPIGVQSRVTKMDNTDITETRYAGGKIKVGNAEVRGFRTINMDEAQFKDTTVAFALYGQDGRPMPKKSALYFSVNYNENGKVTGVHAPVPIKFQDEIAYIERDGKVYTLPVTKTQYESLIGQELAQDGVIRTVKNGQQQKQELNQQVKTQSPEISQTLPKSSNLSQAQNPEQSEVFYSSVENAVQTPVSEILSQLSNSQTIQSAVVSEIPPSSSQNSSKVSEVHDFIQSTNTATQKSQSANMSQADVTQATQTPQADVIHTTPTPETEKMKEWIIEQIHQHPEVEASLLSEWYVAQLGQYPALEASLSELVKRPLQNSIDLDTSSIRSDEDYARLFDIIDKLDQPQLEKIVQQFKEVITNETSQQDIRDTTPLEHAKQSQIGEQSIILPNDQQGSLEQKQLIATLELLSYKRQRAVLQSLEQDSAKQTKDTPENIHDALKKKVMEADSEAIETIQSACLPHYRLVLSNARSALGDIGSSVMQDLNRMSYAELQKADADLTQIYRTTESDEVPALGPQGAKKLLHQLKNIPGIPQVQGEVAETTRKAIINNSNLKQLRAIRGIRKQQEKRQLITDLELFSTDQQLRISNALTNEQLNDPQDVHNVLKQKIRTADGEEMGRIRVQFWLEHSQMLKTAYDDMTPAQQKQLSKQQRDFITNNSTPDGLLDYSGLHEADAQLTQIYRKAALEVASQFRQQDVTELLGQLGETQGISVQEGKTAQAQLMATIYKSNLKQLHTICEKQEKVRLISALELFSEEQKNAISQGLSGNKVSNQELSQSAVQDDSSALKKQIIAADKQQMKRIRDAFLEHHHAVLNQAQDDMTPAQQEQFSNKQNALFANDSEVTPGSLPGYPQLYEVDAQLTKTYREAALEEVQKLGDRRAKQLLDQLRKTEGIQVQDGDGKSDQDVLKDTINNSNLKQLQTICIQQEKKQIISALELFSPEQKTGINKTLQGFDEIHEEQPNANLADRIQKANSSQRAQIRTVFLSKYSEVIKSAYENMTPEQKGQIHDIKDFNSLNEYSKLYEADVQFTRIYRDTALAEVKELKPEDAKQLLDQLRKTEGIQVQDGDGKSDQDVLKDTINNSNLKQLQTIYEQQTKNQLISALKLLSTEQKVRMLTDVGLSDVLPAPLNVDAALALKITQGDSKTVQSIRSAFFQTYAKELSTMQKAFYRFGDKRIPEQNINDKMSYAELRKADAQLTEAYREAALAGVDELKLGYGFTRHLNKQGIQVQSDASKAFQEEIIATINNSNLKQLQAICEQQEKFRVFEAFKSSPLARQVKMLETLENTHILYRSPRDIAPLSTLTQVQNDIMKADSAQVQTLQAKFLMQYFEELGEAQGVLRRIIGQDVKLLHIDRGIVRMSSYKGLRESDKKLTEAYREAALAGVDELKPEDAQKLLDQLKGKDIQVQSAQEKSAQEVLKDTINKVDRKQLQTICEQQEKLRLMATLASLSEERRGRMLDTLANNGFENLKALEFKEEQKIDVAVHNALQNEITKADSEKIKTIQATLASQYRDELSEAREALRRISIQQVNLVPLYKGPHSYKGLRESDEKLTEAYREAALAEVKELKQEDAKRLLDQLRTTKGIQVQSEQGKSEQEVLKDTINKVDRKQLQAICEQQEKNQLISSLELLSQAQRNQMIGAISGTQGCENLITLNSDGVRQDNDAAHKALTDAVMKANNYQMKAIQSAFSEHYSSVLSNAQRTLKRISSEKISDSLAIHDKMSYAELRTVDAALTKAYRELVERKVQKLSEENQRKFLKPLLPQKIKVELDKADQDVPQENVSQEIINHSNLRGLHKICAQSEKNQLMRVVGLFSTERQQELWRRLEIPEQVPDAQNVWNNMQNKISDANSEQIEKMQTVCRDDYAKVLSERRNAVYALNEETVAINDKMSYAELRKADAQLTKAYRDATLAVASKAQEQNKEEMMQGSQEKSLKDRIQKADFGELQTIYQKSLELMQKQKDVVHNSKVAQNKKGVDASQIKAALENQQCAHTSVVAPSSHVTLPDSRAR